ncbi:sodium:alanine symporter family protein [Sutterella sp.]|uniref:alanine/glycine:cation symporter family protein n=1 Tax=Sutterella sp. TaxID=1981025 RepID=UPI0026DFEAC7|nr:sodium:alanine symporter family protein [Sutterella sp.]MDO5530882.1 sodium:alanine symporter family protein [Sutterella sp.]
MELLNTLVSAVNDFLWSYVLIAMLVGLGIWFTIRTGFVQIVRLPEMARLLTEGVGAKTKEGHISTFQAFCVSTASRVGVGNIAGIAIAVTVGGPGSVFWMWVIAILGAATGFVESTLAQVYKAPRRRGGFVGGPAFYIGNALGSPFFATVFAVLLAITYGLIFNSVQANTIALSLKASLGVDPWISAAGVAVLTWLVIFGGLDRIAKVVGWLVPLMAGLYLAVAGIVTVMNITLVPEVLALIVRSAFDMEAAAGAGFGLAVMTGVKRGLFSNEAGMGSVPNAAACADATHPAKQGLVQAIGVFVDTLMVCMSSAMIVLLSPDWRDAGVIGIELAQHALEGQLGSWTGYFLTVIVLFFAFSSIIGNYFYGEVNMDFISRRPKASKIYRGLVIVMVVFGSVASLTLVWNLADLFMAFMAMTNLVAIALLGKIAFIVQKDYFRQKAAGIREPEFDPSVLPSTHGVMCWPRKKDDENV